MGSARMGRPFSQHGWPGPGRPGAEDGVTRPMLGASAHSAGELEDGGGEMLDAPEVLGISEVLCGVSVVSAAGRIRRE